MGTRDNMKVLVHTYDRSNVYRGYEVGELIEVSDDFLEGTIRVRDMTFQRVPHSMGDPTVELLAWMKRPGTFPADAVRVWSVPRTPESLEGMRRFIKPVPSNAVRYDQFGATPWLCG